MDIIPVGSALVPCERWRNFNAIRVCELRSDDRWWKDKRTSSEHLRKWEPDRSQGVEELNETVLKYENYNLIRIKTRKSQNSIWKSMVNNRRTVGALERKHQILTTN